MCSELSDKDRNPELHGWILDSAKEKLYILVTHLVYKASVGSHRLNGSRWMYYRHMEVAL